MQQFNKFFLTYCIAHITILRGGADLGMFESWAVGLYSLYAVVIACIAMLLDLWGIYA